MDNKKKQPLNNQQLTDAVIDHELRISKLETKKKKPPRDCNKPPKITIADVMKTLVEFQNSIDQRFTKLESSVDQRFTKLESSVDQRFTKLESSVDQRFTKLESSVNKRFDNLSERVSKIENEVFKK